MKRLLTLLPALAAISLSLPVSAEEWMDKMWGDRSAKEGVEGSKRAELFRKGNYCMFIDMGLYSHLGGQWRSRQVEP